MGLTEDLKNDPDLWAHYRALGRKMHAQRMIDELEAERKRVGADGMMGEADKQKRIAELNRMIERNHAGIEMLNEQRPEIAEIDTRKFPTTRPPSTAAAE